MKNKVILKRVLSVLLSAALMLTLMPLTLAASEYDADGATKFVFSDSGIAAEDGDYTGYSISGTALSIKSAGTYILSGECADGSITVKKAVTGVTLVLNGLVLTSSDTAPLTCNKSSQAKIVAAEGTVNTFTDSTYNNDDVYTENTNAENAVFKFKDGSQIEICGTGTINVVSNGKNGIKSGATTDTEGEASLTVRDVTLNIEVAVNDGINAEATLNIKSGNITVSAADDGIHSDYVLNIGENSTEGPVIRINKSYEGLEAATLSVYSGNIEIHSDDDGMNAANADLTNYSFSMSFSGGKTVIYAADGDGVDSNGTLDISGGTLIVWTANKADNQPLDADDTITISGGTVFAGGGSSGMGAKINATQTYITLGKSNGMGGGFNFGMGGRPGGMQGPSSGGSSQGSSSGSISASAGEQILVKDSSGNTIFSIETPYDISYILYSSPELVENKKYTVKTAAGSSDVSGSTGSNSSDRCRCWCHKHGILEFFWMLICRWLEAFNIYPVCVCGEAHY